MNEEKNNKHTYGFFKVLGGIIVGVLVVALFALLIGVLIMVLWNWLMPEIFGLDVITYWQGFGIALLVKLLFGEIGSKDRSEKKRSHMYPPKHRYARNCQRGSMKNHWFDDVYEKWWEAEGAERFEEYLKKEPDKEPEDKE